MKSSPQAIQRRQKAVKYIIPLIFILLLLAIGTIAASFGWAHGVAFLLSLLITLTISFATLGLFKLTAHLTTLCKNKIKAKWHARQQRQAFESLSEQYKTLLETYAVEGNANNILEFIKDAGRLKRFEGEGTLLLRKLLEIRTETGRWLAELAILNEDVDTLETVLQLSAEMALYKTMEVQSLMHLAAHEFFEPGLQLLSNYFNLNIRDAQNVTPFIASVKALNVKHYKNFTPTFDFFLNRVGDLNLHDVKGKSAADHLYDETYVVEKRRQPEYKNYFEFLSQRSLTLKDAGGACKKHQRHASKNLPNLFA